MPFSMSAMLGPRSVPSKGGDADVSLTRASSMDDCEPGKNKRAQQVDVDDLIQKLQGMSLEKDLWTQMAQWATSGDTQKQLEGIRNFRMLLSVAGEIPIQDVIEAGVVPAFIHALDSTDSQLKFEAAWAITNIASGTSLQTEMIVQAGAIPKLVQLLAYERDDIREQGMWGLGNIAGDRAAFRDSILNIQGALDLFVYSCRQSQRASTIRTGIWCLSNLCRGKPRPQLHLVQGAIGCLKETLWECEDPDTLSDACWAFDGLSETSEGIADIIKSGVVPRLVELLKHRDVLVSRPALRVVGQIATGNMQQTQTILDSGAVPSLCLLLQAERKSVRKDACWTLSNIAAGTASQLQVLLDSGAIPKLLEVFFCDSEVEVKKEAAWAICNACTSHKGCQLEYILNANCLKPVCDMLEMEDQMVLEVVLDALHNILEFGSKKAAQLKMPNNPCVSQIRNIDGVQKLYNLHTVSQGGDGGTHSYSIWQKSGRLIEEHFNSG